MSFLRGRDTAEERPRAQLAVDPARLGLTAQRGWARLFLGRYHDVVLSPVNLRSYYVREIDAGDASLLMGSIN